MSSIGKITGTVCRLTHNDGIKRLSLKYKELVLSKFLYYYILAKYTAGVMKSMQTQTTGLHNLILDKYLSMPLYLPPYSEQKRIISKIEDMFEKLDAIMESL